MSMFENDERERIRQIIAADYSDSESDRSDGDAGDDLEIDLDDDNEHEEQDADDGSGVVDRRRFIRAVRRNVGEEEEEEEEEDDYDDDDDDEEDDDDDEDDDEGDNDDDELVDPVLRSDAVADAEFDDFEANLRAAAGFSKAGKAKQRHRSGKSKKSSSRHKQAVRREHEPSEEVKILLGLANQAYATNELDEAERILAEIIRIDNNVYAAWKTLGEIHRQRNDIAKCLLAWITAGHLRRKDGELWSICGKLSMEIGLINQSLYCYNRAILANGQDVESIFERGLVFKEMGNLGKALESFKKLQDLLPDDVTVVRELASVFVLQKNLPSAAKLYEDMYAETRWPSTENNETSRQQQQRRPPARFGWSELNILAELYGAQGEYLKAIKFIKATARFFLGRAAEKFWDSMPDNNDEEFEPTMGPFHKQVRAGNYGMVDRFTLPLDLRAKMAAYRLKLAETNAALHHAGFLIKQAESLEHHNKPELTQYADLFQDVADVFADAELYDTALALYAPLAEVEELATPQLVMAMGRCLQGIGDFDQAEAAYLTVIEGDSTNVDAKIALAEVYEATGKRTKALQLVNDVMILRREQDQNNRAGSFKPGHDDELLSEALSQAQPQEQQQHERVQLLPTGHENVLSFIPNVDPRAKARGRGSAGNGGLGRTPRATRSERMEAEEKALVLVAAKARRLKQYQDGLRSGNPVAISEWLQTASELVDMFTNTKAFYLVDKNQVFRGFFPTARRRAKKQNINDRLVGMANRLQESITGSPAPMQSEDDNEGAGDGEKPNTTEFRGLLFDDWLSLFMQYALTLAWHEEIEDAYQVLRKAKDANVFHHDRDRMRVINYVHLSCALHVRDFKTAMEIVRVILAHAHAQFEPAAYRLFLCCMPSGNAASDLFRLASTQKYLLRHVKGADSRALGKTITGSVKVKGQHVAVNNDDNDDGDDHEDHDDVNDEEYDDDDNENGNMNHDENHDDGAGGANVVLLTLYGHILAASRSHVPSLNYYMRAFAVAPADPSVLFAVGLAHLHRAMQRQTNNRHAQIVQGLSFLMEYARVRVGRGVDDDDSHVVAKWNEIEEVEYNLGRAFHMLGLFSLAIKYYENVLDVIEPGENHDDDDDDDDVRRTYSLKYEAAYNLQLVYVMSGNFKLARQLADKYLQV
ncbi:hypothetical protein V1514DRAFT_363827 [Lipomyces japonicus]|uniref:uncharacterized protein n=1 Tax=Lipomyces japonicus TaxID=56871 RepID=UPI0034CD920B